jgi:hypothetical protein
VKLCLDEHYSPRIAADLRERGHDAQSVTERSDLVGLSDRDLITVMTSEARTLVTENVAHFARITQRMIADGESHFGVVFTSPKSMPRSRNTVGTFVRALDAFLRSHPRNDEFVNRTGWLTPP